ncbi:MAG: amidohydrolase family protein [Acidobacteria bacterium]|nr:amidohydrolase family protein [Acidobacteriota bacterium]
MKNTYSVVAMQISVWLLLACAALSQNRPPLVDEMGYADVILVNGKIVTMDDRSIVPETPGHIFEAMAIKGKKIMTLGSTGEIRLLAGPKTQVIDLEKKTVVPGLIQTHYHLFGSAASRYGESQGLIDPSVKLRVVAEKTPEGTAKKLRETIVNAIQVQKIPKGHWITVNVELGKDNHPNARSWMYLGQINRRQFDSAIPEHPVFIGLSVGGIFNAKAIQEFKREFPDWEDSTDLENGPGSAEDGYAPVPESGALKFELWWKKEPIEKLAETMRLQGLDVARNGITAVATRILYPEVIAAYNYLNRQGKMPHRLAYYIESQRGNFWDLKTTRQFYRGMGAPWTDHANGAEMLWLNGMANEIWDASDGVCMGPDVPAPPEVTARQRCPAPGTRPWEAYKAAIVNGWRPAGSHGTSSHGVRLYIRMLEEAMKEGNFSLEYMRSLRTTVEHNQLIGTPPDVIAGIKKFGIILNVATFRLRDIPWITQDYGEQLRPFVMPLKTWINDGIRVTFEADSTEFWVPIHRLMTREVTLELSGEKRVVRPEEAIDRVTALKMVTTWASEYLLAENTIGTLEPGKYADFAVLDRDFFTIPVAEIPSVGVVMTGLSGKIVWQGEPRKTAVRD